MRPPARWVPDPPQASPPPDQIVPMLQMAVAAAPDQVELRRRLARLLLAAQRLADLEELALPQLDERSPDPEVLYCLGMAAVAAERTQLALRALQRASELGHPRSAGGLANLLYRLGRYDEALELGLSALEHDPGDFYAAGPVVRVLLARGEPDRLWSLCERIRGGGGWGAFIPSAMALAARNEAQHRAVERIVGRERWFERRRLGFSPEFNDRLAARLRSLMGNALPVHKASTGSGGRIDQLQLAARGDEVLARLFDALRRAVEDYLAAREATSGDGECWPPAGSGPPEVLRFDSWGVATNRDGHEKWHMHPSGWLSGVYYIAVPEPASSAQPHAGEIEFGPYPFGTSVQTPGWPRWHVRPAPGELLLFPSSYGHRTWPTGAEEDRIIVAFDVLAGTPAD